MDRRQWRAGAAGLAFAAAGAVLGYAISGRLPLPARTPALLAPAVLAAAILASSNRRFVRRVGYGLSAMPPLAVIALLALATCDRLAGAWSEMGLASMIYQAFGVAGASLGVTYGWRYGMRGCRVLGAVVGCWLTAFIAVAWSLALPDMHTVIRPGAAAVLAVAAGGAAGWLVGYGLRMRRAAAPASSRLGL